jgi:hypothetical protein
VVAEIFRIVADPRISMITLRRINGPGRFLMLASPIGAKVRCRIHCRFGPMTER